MQENFEKMRIALRYWLIGKGFYKAVEAMDFAEQYHSGKRKDGSPEFSHQISQASLARTLINSIKHKEELFIVIFLHDSPEDVHISFEEIDNKYGNIAGNAIRLMTKLYRGVKTPNDIYYNNLVDSEIASVAKGIDRFHNILSMLGGFTPEKQVSYVEETIKKVLPLLKFGRRRFPEQTAAYENIKLVLIVQLRLYNELNKHLISK